MNFLEWKCMNTDWNFTEVCSSWSNNIAALVQIMAWRRPGDKPLSGPMMVRLPTHICVTRPQWVIPSHHYSFYVPITYFCHLVLQFIWLLTKESEQTKHKYWKFLSIPSYIKHSLRGNFVCNFNSYTLQIESIKIDTANENTYAIDYIFHSHMETLYCSFNKYIDYEINS